MSVRSLICIEQKDKRLIGVYCHSRGELEYNGAMLLEYYNNRKKVEELIKIGDLSYLQKKLYPSVNSNHSFDHPEREVCVVYGRDRGDIYTCAKEVNPEIFLSPSNLYLYCYIYCLDNRWRYIDCSNDIHKYFDLELGVATAYVRMGFFN